MGNEDRPRVWQTFSSKALVKWRDNAEIIHRSTHISTYCSGSVNCQIHCLVVSERRLGNDDIV